MKKNTENTREIKFIDLFAGLGGIRLGFEQALHAEGLCGECVFTSEIKPYALKAYNANFPGENIQITDITKVKGNDIGEFNILLGGFPCQAFSAAGYGKGFADTRGTLFFDIQRIIEDHIDSIDGFILENVEGLVTHDMPKDEKDWVYDNGIKIGNTLNCILKILREKLGFNVSWTVLNASHFGVPQKRKRIYIVGCKKEYGLVDLHFEKQPEAHAEIALEHGLPCLNDNFSQTLLSLYTPQELKGKALKDKRGGKKNIHSWDLELKGKISQEEKDLLNTLVCQRRQHKWADIIGIEWMDGMPLTESQIYSFFPHPNLKRFLNNLTKKRYLVFEHPKQRKKGIDDNGNVWFYREPDVTKEKGYNIVTGKMSFPISSFVDPNSAVNTIVAMDMNTIGVVDNDGIRHLSLREGLRLFGYPETYSLDIFEKEKNGIKMAYDLLGNSVCVPVIKCIAQRLITTIFK